MRRLWVALLLLVMPAFGQSLVEITTVAAISSTLDASVRFPSGSFRAGRGSDAIVARIADRANFNLEVYVAKGVAARLQPAFVQQISTSFAVAGYFLQGTQQSVVGGETQTRYNFLDENGRKALLFTVQKGDELVFVFGKAK